MKIKVGQYARLDNGKIVKIVKVSAKIENAWFMCEVDIYSQSMITKVANTPQELIEVGDLVERKSIVGLHYVEDDNFSVSSITYLIENVTKILTPNSNGGYDLQWELKGSE